MKLGDIPLGSGTLKKAAKKIRKSKKTRQQRLDEIMNQMGAGKKKPTK